jgi:hypothetical protein
MRFSVALRRTPVVRLISVVCQKGPYEGPYIQLVGTWKKAIIPDTHILPIINSTCLPRRGDDVNECVGRWNTCVNSQRRCYCDTDYAMAHLSYYYFRTAIWIGSLHNYRSFVLYLQKIQLTMLVHFKYYVVEHTSKLISFESECNWG